MKIQILIEDRPNDSVFIKFTPALVDIVNNARIGNKSGLSPAATYACHMADTAKEISKRLDKYDPKKNIEPGL